MGFPFLVRRGARFYFRVRIPVDLREPFGRLEVWRSLKTADHRKARTMGKLEAAKAEITFEKMRNRELTRDQLRKIAEEYLHSTLEHCEGNREGGFLPRTHEEKEGKLLAYGDLADRYKGALSDLDVQETRARGLKRAGELVDSVLEERGLTLPKDSEEYAILARELLKRALEVCTVEASRITGDYSNDYDRSRLYRKQEATEEKQAGLLLSEVIQAYVKDHLTCKKWTPKTEQENTSILAVFLELIGDRDITTITHQDLMSFRDTLVKLPANPKKGRAKEGKPLKEVLEMGLPPMSLSTVRKYLIRIASFFKWAKLHKYVTTNEAEGLTLKEKKKEKASAARDTYEKEDIQRLFHALEYAPNKPERFWIPLISLYSGARLNEICQLHLEDVQDIDGVPCFRIEEEGSKKVKTVAGKRVVPVHPVLIELGFMRYVQRLREKGAKRLWENLKLKRDGYGQDFGKWYQRFNRKHITSHKKKVFHSFRHTVATALKQSGVLETVAAEILGHENPNMTYSRYGKGYHPKPMLVALSKVDYGVDIGELREKANTGLDYRSRK